MRRIGLPERQARLGIRHRLATAARAERPGEVAASLVALHGTTPASVYLSALARMRDGTSADIEHALYTERSLVRLLGMRRTMFVMERELAPVVQAGCTRAIAAQQRRRFVQQLQRAGIAPDPASWLSEVEESTVRALRARGNATASELAEDEPRLRTSIVVAAGKPYEAKQNVSSRILLLLGADGRIVRGRPQGSWTSSRYSWWPMESWLPDGMPELPLAAAQVELARRWLAAYGPATVQDMSWWTGWTVAQTKKALASLAPVEVDLGGSTGVVLPDDVEPVPAPDPWAALLPGLDPSPMGWAHRDWFLGDHAPALFDRSGNVGPTVWWNGRIVGGWAQRGEGDIVVRVLDDVGSEAVHAIDVAAERLRDRLGDVRVTPSFRTPLERELSA
ncbi:MAG: winged helix DNA-binding domain-containing protein [Sciscionella sp.]